MRKDKTENIIEQILASSGIEIDGHNPWDIKIINDNFYRRVLKQQSLGLGETYMDGWWDCEKLDEFFYKLLRSRIDTKLRNNWRILLRIFLAKVSNMQYIKRAFQIAEKHYDLGNKLFENMLDSRMVYSCAYWKDAKTFDQAQENKLDLVCRKLFLQPGMTVLDIGCGWGSFAKYAAEKYKVSVLGITVSKEQVELGRKFCTGLPVEIRLQGYRDLVD